MIPAWLEVLNPQARLGRVRFAVFDFDDTISILRRGWQAVMQAVMLECICPGEPPQELVNEVADYIRQSAGVPTLQQMEWLENAVGRYGWAEQVLPAVEYKRLYTQRLLVVVAQRTAGLDGSRAQQDRWMVAGARAFLEALAARGVTLSLASGTDHVCVEREANLLGVAGFFTAGIHGAREDDPQDMKAKVIRQALGEHRLVGEELLAVGDGPAEIRHVKAAGGLGLGVSSDPARRRNLAAAGADLLVEDFRHAGELAALLAGSLASN